MKLATARVMLLSARSALLRQGASVAIRAASTSPPPPSAAAPLPQPTEQLAPLPLLRSILRLHRRLPPALRYMGDRYVLDEFRRHREAEERFVAGFLAQWNGYLLAMRDQVSREETRGKLGVFGEPEVGVTGEWVGKDLGKDVLDKMTDAQVGQLWALREEAKSLGRKEVDAMEAIANGTPLPDGEGKK
ncbi:hypothetical protein DFJ74DRAFT_670617 [Hyaloraphidium curvatum]|nr:hypothetical protein DFJ74DRAFT_670617 [Hyaloraphidium curvatum]